MSIFILQNISYNTIYFPKVSIIMLLFPSTVSQYVISNVYGQKCLSVSRSLQVSRAHCFNEPYDVLPNNQSRGCFVKANLVQIFEMSNFHLWMQFASLPKCNKNTYKIEGQGLKQINVGLCKPQRLRCVPILKKKAWRQQNILQRIICLK